MSLSKGIFSLHWKTDKRAEEAFWMSGETLKNLKQVQLPLI